jgi:hypothetical protein
MFICYLEKSIKIIKTANISNHCNYAKNLIKCYFASSDRSVAKKQYVSNIVIWIEISYTFTFLIICVMFIGMLRTFVLCHTQWKYHKTYRTFVNRIIVTYNTSLTFGVIADRLIIVI